MIADNREYPPCAVDLTVDPRGAHYPHADGFVPTPDDRPFFNRISSGTEVLFLYRVLAPYWLCTGPWTGRAHRWRESRQDGSSHRSVHGKAARLIASTTSAAFAMVPIPGNAIAEPSLDSIARSASEVLASRRFPTLTT